jgi:hypothetical protein
MTSLTATDLQGEYQGKLNGHLKSEDFLNWKNIQQQLWLSKIGTKSANIYTAVADLTIKE